MKRTGRAGQEPCPSAGAGIAYPPALLFLVAIVVLVIKALFGDIELTKLRRDVRRLNQRIALIESGQLPDVQAREEAPGVTEPGQRERS